MAVNFEVGGKRVFAATGEGAFDSARPAVVFLHGAGFDHGLWEGLGRFFSVSGYVVAAPDLPGHTNSEGPELDTIEAMAGWLDDAVNALGIGDFSLVGHSMGCLIALEYGLRNPKKMRSVSFIAGAAATPVNPALIEAAQHEPDAAVDMMLSWSFDPARLAAMDSVADESLTADAAKTLRGNAPKALAADLKACDAYRNGIRAAAGIRCPGQVILGGRDRMVRSEAGQTLAHALGGPQPQVIGHSGHMVPLEAPDETRELLQAFIFANNPAPAP